MPRRLSLPVWCLPLKRRAPRVPSCRLRSSPQSFGTRPYLQFLSIDRKDSEIVNITLR